MDDFDREYDFVYLYWIFVVGCFRSIPAQKAGPVTLANYT